MSQLENDEPTTGIDPLQELGKQLPWDRPDAARREAVRSSLLSAAADAPPARSGRAFLVGAGFVAGALAAAAVALIVVRASPMASPSAPIAAASGHESYAHIESSSVAELEHTSTPTASGTDEIVRIRGGKVRLAVPAAVRAGDRVRTRTGDAEIEATGAYEVVVANDKLTSVHVASGTVKVIVDGQTIVLATGETWTAPIITADLSPAAAPAATTAPGNADARVVDPPVAEPLVAAVTARPHHAGAAAVAMPTVAPSEARAPRPSVLATLPPSDAAPPTPSISAGEPPAQPPVASSTEEHFRAGWALLRDNKFGAAADELGLAATGTEPLAADARYLQAVALTKAGRPRDAETALVAFLDTAPSSTRRGRAAIMLGRLIAARGELASARAWFSSAAADADASVAGAAKAELAKLDGVPR